LRSAIQLSLVDHEDMKQRRIFVRLALVFLLVGAAMCWGAAHEIKAFRDIKGNSWPTTFAARGAATVTCVRAVQSAPLKPGDMRPACYVAAQGVEQRLPINASLVTKGAGTVTLTCTGVGQLDCTARISE
jgi:hypothetical protein